MHSAKGLEWPIVIPINTVGEPRKQEGVFVDSRTGALFCSVLSVNPSGYEEAREHEMHQQALERQRLWYVALTRARDSLLLPRWTGPSRSPSWADLIKLHDGSATVETLDVASLAVQSIAAITSSANEQTREVFAQQAAALTANERTVNWQAPSRDEIVGAPASTSEAAKLHFISDGEQGDQLPLPQGSSRRGIILHKLIEEVLTGEQEESAEALQERALQLISSLGDASTADASEGLSASELANTVTRTLALPEIAELRSTLIPELTINHAETTDGVENVIAGISDAVSYDSRGAPKVVVDWKSDTKVNSSTISRYRSQISAYMRALGVERGLIVFMTPGRIEEVVSQITAGA